LTELVSGRYERGSGGKFITVYPRDDDHFRRLAEQLDQATRQLPGPGILSDRPYRPGSLVHYRYGAFSGRRRLTNDGAPEPMLQAPDGTYLRDRRTAGFTPPPWAELPLPAPEQPPAAPGTAVLLNERYVVRSAIRHAYKGGVFLATDQRGGHQVVIKEARHHVGSGLDGADAVDLLEHEARMLALLADLELSPRPLELFSQGGNRYLVQERIAGQTLRSWASQQLEPGVDLLLKLADQLTSLVLRVHERGLVLRDLNPNNLMVTPADELRLIDLETLARPGDQVRRVFTKGYAAPEVMDAAPGSTAPALESDLFSVGAVLFHLCTGADPLLAADRPEQRSRTDRLAGFLAAALADRPDLRIFEQPMLGLTAEDPGARWSLAQVRDHLLGRTAARTAASVEDAPQQRLLDDGLTHLLDTMTPDDPERLWPGEGFAAATDPLNVQHGAAGVLAVLTAAAKHSTDPRLRTGVAEAASWLAARADRSEQHLPGLYFGRSGTAWALLDAARLLGDDALADRAARLALQVPVRWPNPDICHGVAGAGLAQLHFWQVTGEPEFERRAVTAADQLLGAAVLGSSGLLWPVPAKFDSALAGITHLGFGHGVAGIGAFLLLAGLATGREDFLAAARQAGETLLATRQVQDGAAGWPVDGRNPDAPVHAPQWCNGSAGIGGFLVRLWQATGDPRHREAAEQAALQVYRWRRRGSAAACHGLVGNAEFLLDLADAAAEPQYRRWAKELVGLAHARNVVRDGLLLVPDETLTAVSAAYQTGLSGLLALLVRLRHGGNRLWLPPVPATVLQTTERR
jgi:hypothetical protein